MLLTVDLGNSTMSLAVCNAGRPAWRGKVKTRSIAPEKLFSGIPPQLFRRKIKAAAVASVVPELDGVLSRQLRRAFKVEPFFLNHRNCLGLPLLVRTPEQLGADRIAACLGALSLLPPPLLVVDAGTAVTFEAINRAGEYLGGAIMPGPELAGRSLAQGAARLRKVAPRKPEGAIGRDSMENIRAGLYYGLVGAVKTFIGEYRSILGPEMKVLACGGAISLVRDEIPEIDLFEPDLIHIGLYRAWLARREN